MKIKIGIDLGATSLGWCVFDLDENNEIKKVIDCGVRIFPDGRDEKSKEPLSVTRRNARSQRRNRDRYKQRREMLMQALIESKLMPQDINERKNLEKFNPYKIRANAVKQKITLYELGRALFHINQRRGFKSNRKVDKKIQDEKGKVAVASKKLKDDISQKNFKTLGEYLYYLYKNGKSVRIRMENNQYNFYPTRDMYENEFDIIWDKQAKYYKELTDKLKNKIKDIIFMQRDLKPQEPGFCEFETNEHRITKAHPLFQDFRIEQDVNSLEISFPPEKKLTDEQKNQIKNILNNCEIAPNKNNMEIAFSKICKKIGLDKKVKFNFETENRKGFKCNTTNYYLSQKNAFGDDWYKFDSKSRQEIVEKLLSNEKDEDIIKWLKNKFKFDNEKASNIVNTLLEDGYGSLSKKAIEKILPYLKKGFIYSEACEKAGYKHSDHRPERILDLLPYYGEVMPNKVLGAKKDDKYKNNPEVYYGKINNPSVHVALNQLRKVINAIIEKYGKPEEIVIELARELKLGTNGLKELMNKQKENQEENKKIDEILKKNGLPINFENRLRYKLWEELDKKPQNRRCIFSGKQISLKDIWSDKFEIEHLLPFSRTYDDRVSNKVLSSREANRKKANKTPFEAFGHTKEWPQILKRIEKLPDNKKWRFRKDAMARYEKEGGPIERMLNDTKYMARIAKEYLNFICKKVYAIPGQLTGILRNVWGLNYLKEKDNPESARIDHRHHAIDAFILGCTTPGMLQLASQCSDWAEKAGGNYEGRKKLFKGKFIPYPNFDKEERENFKKIIENIVVSYKPDHKNAEFARSMHSTIGRLHDETAYGPTNSKAKKGYRVVSIRRNIMDLEEKHLNQIVDKKIAEQLKKIFKTEKNSEEIKKLLQDYINKNNIKKVKCHIEKDKRVLIPIYKRKKDGTYEEKPYKYFVSGNNYCIDIYCLRPDDKKDPENAGKWQGEVISNFEVHKPGFEPKWRKEHPTAKKIMRLFINDMIILTFDRKEPEEDLPKNIKKFILNEFKKTKNRYVNMIFRVKKIAQSGRFFISPNFISRDERDLLSWGASVSGIFKYKARQIYVNELGKYKDPGFNPGWEEKNEYFRN